MKTSLKMKFRIAALRLVDRLTASSVTKPPLAPVVEKTRFSKIDSYRRQTEDDMVEISVEHLRAFVAFGLREIILLDKTKGRLADEREKDYKLISNGIYDPKGEHVDFYNIRMGEFLELAERCDLDHLIEYWRHRRLEDIKN